MTSPSSVPTMAGRPVSSARRPATRPRIPTGHGPVTRSAAAAGPPATRIRGASAGRVEPRLLARSLARVRHAERGPRLGDRRPHEVPARRVGLLEHRREGRRLVRGLGEQQAGGIERLPHPSGRVEPRREREADVSRSAAAGRTPARSSRAAMPGRGAVRIRSRPSRAIARFSPRIGATSETVPIVARSASSSASASAPRELAEQQAGHGERDAGARELRVRVGGVRAMRVHESDGRGQDLGQVMVVRDDDVDPARQRPRHLGDAR